MDCCAVAVLRCVQRGGAARRAALRGAATREGEMREHVEETSGDM